MKTEIFIDRLSNILGKDVSRNISYSEEDIQVVIKFIRTGKIQIEDIVAITSIFAYVSYDKTKELEEEVTRYISLNHKDIVSRLDSFPQIHGLIKETSPNINFYKRILSSTFGGNLIEDIWSVTTQHLFKCINGLYGVKYFLLKLLLSKSKEFDSWMKISVRNDLKYALLDELLCDREFSSLSDNAYSCSENPYIRCLYFFAIYENSSSFENIYTPNFPEKDQLFLSLFILLFHHPIFYGEKDFDHKYEKLIPLLDKISQSGLLTYLTGNSFRGFRITFFNRTTICLLLDRLKDSELKKELFVWLYNSIFEKDLGYINVRTILLVNVIIKAIEENKTLLPDLRKKYKKILEKTLFPYSYNRNPESWNSNIMMLLFLTIALVLTCPNDKDRYILNFKKARKKKHVQDELIDEMLTQLIEVQVSF